jgi:hypothetical protein
MSAASWRRRACPARARVAESLVREPILLYLLIRNRGHDFQHCEVCLSCRIGEEETSGLAEVPIIEAL